MPSRRWSCSPRSELSAVCFRWANAEADTLNDRNEAILRDVNQAGRVWLSNASIRGAVGLRACITNHQNDGAGRTTAVVEEVLAAADRVTAPPRRRHKPTTTRAHILLVRYCDNAASALIRTSRQAPAATRRSRNARG